MILKGTEFIKYLIANIKLILITKIYRGKINNEKIFI